MVSSPIRDCPGGRALPPLWRVPPSRGWRLKTTRLRGTAGRARAYAAGGQQQSRLHGVKVGMDGTPYLRKVDIKTNSSYECLSMALEKMLAASSLVSGVQVYASV
ncbi:unnamed protein product [Miscanthus lutarioriparius]|uniref:Auxin-responsive protein n=1 Tax=Miscanthus lutarioriparius TaxID=422564 RepID=A0A811RL53_9POAL|nr:unnamed protein product [Miscanthus lutarioriparius]